MLDSNQERRRKWVIAVAGGVGFVLCGIALLPGLVRNEPTPVPFVEPPARVPVPISPMRQPAPEQASAPPDAIAAGKPTPASTTAATLTPIRSDLSFSFDCMIAPFETVQIGSAITGLIDSIDVERSDFVEAGDVVARLESSVEQAAVEVARARAERTVEIDSSRASHQLGKKRLSRATDLFQEESLSLDLHQEIETEATLAALSVAEARENRRLAGLQLRQAQAALERRTIRSPISGYIVERSMSAGEVVDEQIILSIAQIDPLGVEVILPTHLLGNVRTGDLFEVTPEPPHDQPVVAEVDLVDRVVDGASGTFGVRLLLDNPDHALPGGLRCQARRLPEARQKEHAAARAESARKAAGASDDPV